MFKSFFSPIYQLENFIHYLLTDDKWRLLILENEGSRLVSASQYQGLNNYDLVTDAPYHNKKSFLENSKTYSKAILANPVSGQGLLALGKAALLNVTNALGDPSVDPIQKEGQVALSTQLQVGMCLFDNLGICIFSGFCLAEPANLQVLVNMVAARFGGEWDVDRLMGIAVQTLAME